MSGGDFPASRPSSKIPQGQAAVARNGLEKLVERDLADDRIGHRWRRCPDLRRRPGIVGGQVQVLGRVVVRAVHQLDVPPDRRSPGFVQKREQRVDVQPVGPLRPPEVAVARPGVVGRAPRDAGLDRVAVDIADERAEMPVIPDEKRLVPALEQVADAVVTAVEPAGIGRVRPPNDPRKGLRAGPDREVHVIGHQAVRESSNRNLCRAPEIRSRYSSRSVSSRKSARRSLPRAVT